MGFARRRGGAPSSTQDSAGRLRPVVPPPGPARWVQPAIRPRVGPAVRRAGRCPASRLTEGSPEQMGGGRPASLRQHHLRGEEAGPEGGDGQQRAGAQDCPALPVT